MKLKNTQGATTRKNLPAFYVKVSNNVYLIGLNQEYARRFSFDKGNYFQGNGEVVLVTWQGRFIYQSPFYLPVFL